MKKHLALLILATLAITTSPLARAAAFPLKTCIVTGDELGDDPVDVNYKGRLIRLCCKSCVKKFNANPEKYVAILDKELAKRKK
jgi:hypothetical protein